MLDGRRRARTLPRLRRSASAAARAANGRGRRLVRTCLRAAHGPQTQQRQCNEASCTAWGDALCVAVALAWVRERRVSVESHRVEPVPHTVHGLSSAPRGRCAVWAVHHAWPGVPPAPAIPLEALQRRVRVARVGVQLVPVTTTPHGAPDQQRAAWKVHGVGAPCVWPCRAPNGVVRQEVLGRY